MRGKTNVRNVEFGSFGWCYRCPLYIFPLGIVPKKKKCFAKVNPIKELVALKIPS